MHSSLIAETAAHICGFAAGCAGYVVAGYFTQDIFERIRIGMFTSYICNAVIGGHINYLAKDFFSLIVIRPISAYFGAKLFQLAADTMERVH